MARIAYRNSNGGNRLEITEDRPIRPKILPIILHRNTVKAETNDE